MNTMRTQRAVLPLALLSAAFMLICTNDGFSGVDSLMLPASGSTTVETNAYDAGSEQNTEDFADIVPPCQGLIGVESDDEGTGVSNPALAEGGVREGDGARSFDDRVGVYRALLGAAAESDPCAGHRDDVFGGEEDGVLAPLVSRQGVRRYGLAFVKEVCDDGVELPAEVS